MSSWCCCWTTPTARTLLPLAPPLGRLAPPRPPSGTPHRSNYTICLEGKINIGVPTLEDRTRLFGFYIKPSYEETLNRNWETQIDDIRNVLMSFNLRALNTLQQRIYVLQIFVCSRYKAHSLPLPGRVAESFGSFLRELFCWMVA